MRRPKDAPRDDTRDSDAGDLAPTLADLDTLPLSELQSHWTALTARPLPRVRAGVLRLALAWELQARAQGGLSRRCRQRLDQLAGGRTRTVEPAPGMRLVREWNGTLHQVEIDGEGVVRWNGATWRSLSAVARAITGTRWSGPAFFGLKQKAGAR